MSMILVIDDDAGNRKLLRGALENQGHGVIEAANGREGLWLFHRHPVQLVITGIVMPEREGLETIRELRQSHPDIRIIAMSGHRRLFGRDYLPAAKAFGANRVVAKPFKLREMLGHVQELLGEGNGTDLIPSRGGA